MGQRIAVIGAGAVGGYVGSGLAASGQDVTLIDPWPAHIEAIRSRGMRLSGMTPAETRTVEILMYEDEVVVGRDLANSRDWPAWKPGDEFEGARNASASARQ